MPRPGLKNSFRDSFRLNGVIKTKKGTEDRPDFKKLKSIEKERRGILLRAELPLWRILLFWSGTCLKEVIADPLVWITLVLYCAIRAYAWGVDAEDAPAFVNLFQSSNISIIGGFLSFFLIIFVNQTNSRFLEMYGFSKACSGRIQDAAGMARAVLPPEDGDRLVRHFNAAQLAGYVGLNAIGQGSPYSRTHFFDVYNGQYALLNDAEMQRLKCHDMDNSGLCMKELCTWCQVDVAEARKAGHLNDYQEQYLHDRILQFRAAMDGIYDYTDQPPQFFYINFLCVLSAIYLPLFAIETAYTGGWGENCFVGLDILNGLVVLLQCIFVVGLRSLGTKMIDPYGDDWEDLSVILYVEATLEICSTIMNSKGGSTDIKWVLPPLEYNRSESQATIATMQQYQATVVEMQP